MQLSIRELLVVVTFIGIAMAGIITGPPISWVALVAFVGLLLALAIDVFVAADQKRIFAVGFLIPALAYLGAIVLIGSTEFAAASGRVPTSQLLQFLLRPPYVMGQSPDQHFLERMANARSVMPLGHAAIAAVLGYAWKLVRATARKRKTSHRVDCYRR